MPLLSKDKPNLCYNSCGMILVTGGTGFIGQALVRNLAALGRPVRILLRPSAASPQLPQGIPIEVAVSGLRDERGVRAAMKGVTVVYHLAGSERMGSHADLTGVDIEGTQGIAQAAAQAGVERLFFISHLGADRLSAFPVLRAKALAEAAIRDSGVPYTIFRSGVVFGPGDQFTLPLTKLLRLSPGVFLIPGDGSLTLQPLWIDDLIACLTWALDDDSMVNQVVEIGGSEYLTYLEIANTLLQAIHIKRILVPFPPPLLRNVGLFLEQSSSKFPISLFWLDYLAADRICDVDTLPRLFGLMPARFSQQLQYLNPPARGAARRSL